MQIQDIAKNQDIPLRYLVQILIRLKSKGWVESVRGQSGGYRLKKRPDQISLGEVLRDIEGPVLPVVESTSSSKRMNVFNGTWRNVEKAINDVVNSVTFDDLRNKIKNEKNVPMYVI
ncbi:MAG: hypothetical protein A3G33_04245 [Omnitrophica bacterium RIFCSPLOWO2_12_FULL_44_17]|uniref:Rrf2 family transcriptional regulator n=1 Tax=Candidatus Danuiimicrobium aquiferis TaxID=1801832 RepID=A0A1G1KQH7_9BACT|nr:MAG: hypothetical protein A3B72_10455 [Omnitrophica bacterium RIFCSPHIGHO2_02_FULL_45_28]OGW89538.1 MAG: hypothetical protein A3E74_07945 [Omnitrophica bacterium RIFCSPHIGHO2_12_FULL_44_12]OGW95148.1 MAG: hypothetical protein A3G33_04245 [Omnitrophica bacterium RIFCSPLOWO2_12_FULL_44_17]OGX01707.1 MAG: hypothetical protein A3J12_04190 [Omnitrophica bacterium RIFCSPLOWO2_02_FULL_44_11]